MPDFWTASGFHLLTRNGQGHLDVTDDFLRAYFERPELRPVPESCAAERALHADLLAVPRRSVPAERIERLADADARENYRVMLRFRDLLLRYGTVERCYLGLFRGKAVPIPSLFIDHMVHVICRNIFDGCEDPMRLRAAELLFRSQKAMIRDGAVLLADEETVDMYARSSGFGRLGELLAESGTLPRRVELDVLTEENKESYWTRSDRYETVLDLTFARSGLDALCRVLEAWIRHFFGVETTVQPVQSIRDERWRWHVGLDAEASGILNDLYEGKEVAEDRLQRLLCLFRLEFRDPAVVLPDVAGRPVYLALAMTSDHIVRMKPQNLLVNLPLLEAT